MHADHETRAKEMDSIVDFFEREGVPDAQPITGDMHDLVRQDESAAEVLLRRTGVVFSLRCHKLRTSTQISKDKLHIAVITRDGRICNQLMCSWTVGAVKKYAMVSRNH